MKKKCPKIDTLEKAVDKINLMAGCIFELEDRILTLEKCALDTIKILNKHFGDKNAKKEKELDEKCSKKSGGTQKKSRRKSWEDDHEE